MRSRRAESYIVYISESLCRQPCIFLLQLGAAAFQSPAACTVAETAESEANGPIGWSFSGWFGFPPASSSSPRQRIAACPTLNHQTSHERDRLVMFSGHVRDRLGKSLPLISGAGQETGPIQTPFPTTHGRPWVVGGVA